MKLLTKKIENELAKYPICSQDGKGKDAKIICKFFLTCSDYTFYVLEGEKLDDGNDYEFFGIGYMNGCSEYGYVTLSQLKSVRNRLGLGIERDLYFENKKVGDLENYELPNFLRN